MFREKNLSSQSIVLILDGIEDPKNFGAIIRTAWLMGVQGVFVPSRRSVSLTPSVMKSANGGVEHVPVVFCQNLGSSIKRLKELGFWIYGLDHLATDSIWSEDFNEPTAFVLGGEGHGIRKPIAKACDKHLSIPQHYAHAMYNVSVATALVLGEYARQSNQNTSSNV